MDGHERIEIVLGTTSGVLMIGLVLVLYCYCKRWSKVEELEGGGGWSGKVREEEEELVAFAGGEHLRIGDILDSPGEVVGKSSYGTLYIASLARVEAVVVLRFLRPACTERTREIAGQIEMLGIVRHSNLVPLQAFYSGHRGEKLLVHPFFNGGNLAQFIREAIDESYRWPVVCKISLGIARGLDYLHSGLQKPIIHGNLKSKNILLDSYFQPYLSDFGLHLLLNRATAQEMLETSADQGYKAPELMKMKDASMESDIYCLGVIFLEMLTRKEPIRRSSSSPLDVHLPTSMCNAVLNHKVPEMFDMGLLKQTIHQNSVTEEGLLMYFQLAMSCCSPSPALRPVTRQIVKKLEEIGQS